MRNALVIVIVCLSVSLLYDVYKEPIDRLLHLDQTETNETTETGNVIRRKNDILLRQQP